MTLPAERMRIASTWSSFVSTPATGSTIVRSDCTVTVRYSAIPKMKEPVSDCAQLANHHEMLIGEQRSEPALRFQRVETGRT